MTIGCDTFGDGVEDRSYHNRLVFLSYTSLSPVQVLGAVVSRRDINLRCDAEGGSYEKASHVEEWIGFCLLLSCELMGFRVSSSITMSATTSSGTVDVLEITADDSSCLVSSPMAQKLITTHRSREIWFYHSRSHTRAVENS